MAVAVRSETGELQSPDETIRVWKERITQAREARKPFERIWLSNAAFRAGQHWLVYDQGTRQMRHISDVDPRYANRTLYTADRINEYVQAQLGELASGDDRPELLTAQEGDTAEEIAKMLNSGVAYAWQHEWKADTALARARSYAATFGVAAIRSRRDPNKGAPAGYAVYDAQGQQVKDQAALQHLEAYGQLPDGSLPKIKPTREGATVWEAFTAFQILTPPGVTHEDDFPWEILVRPVLVDDLVAEYPDTAQDLVEDGDIASAMGLATGQNVLTVAGQGAKGRLRDHVWLYTCYLRPCRKYPDGRVVVLASNQYRLLDIQEQLPYEAPDKSRVSGIVYLHWWRLDDRFQSRAFIEPLKDPQRALNEDKTIKREILVRGLPKVFVTEGDLPHNPAGLPLEIIEMKKGADAPQFHAGVAPGTWWDQDIIEAVDDMSHASTLGQVRLGENPANAQTFGQLALLNDNEAVKRSQIRIDQSAQIGTLVECGVFDIRQFWPEEKLVMVEGDEGRITEQTFRKSQIPPFIQVRVAKGGTLPRLQGAELKKVDAIWTAATQSSVVLHDPQRWTKWYAESLEAGEAQELPEVEQDSQERMAAYENFLLLRGEMVQPAPYDLLPVHIPIHREAQDEARAAGDLEAVARIQAHCDMSVELQSQNAAMIGQAQQAPSPLGASPLAQAAAPPVQGGFSVPTP